MTDWQFRQRFEAAALRTNNPVPLLLEQLRRGGFFFSNQETVYTVLSELYSNALEHGVLELDSTVKNTAEGFEKYYQQREQRLKNLNQGFVSFSFHHHSGQPQSWLDITIENSGQGFDYQAFNRSKQPAFSGRGLSLIESLCDKVEYSNGGCRAQVRVLT
jgi:anti-sigma regulatory factor (Ser/Thr protein kinase)